jgi:hypothetical protein
MPDRPDSAMDFHASAFCREVLDAAHRLRFSRERITYGQDIYGSFRSRIWPANTLDEIAEGRRLAGTRRVPLARLNGGSRPYGRLVSNILRPFGRRECKDHFLLTFPDDRPVAFTVFDFDRHIPAARGEPISAESDEWLAIDEGFWHGVGLFHRLAEELDLDVMWVTSPGRWLVDGHGLPCRMSGLYAVVRHEPRTPSELRPMLDAIKERCGLDVETSWDTKNRNTRIPGQCFMDPCLVDPARRTIVPIRDPEARTEREMNMARLAATVEGYGALRRGGGERLLALGFPSRPPGARDVPAGEAGSERAAEGLMASQIGEGGLHELAASPIGQDCGSGRGVRPSGRDATAGKRGSTSARHVRKPAPSDGADPTRWLREPDTFRALHESGLLRQALPLFGWDPAQSGEAVQWMAPRFRGLRSASSATCSDPETLAAFLRKHYLWACGTYDPKKAKAGARAKARAEDEARIAASLRLGDKALEAYLRVVAGLSGKEMESVRRFRGLERRWAGRISCRALYAAFGSQRRFMAFRARHRILRVAAGHSQSRGRCRQWTLAPNAVRSVRMLMASPVLLFMLWGERERGRVTYIETHQRDLQRRRRISAVHPAREARRALESVTGTAAARGPPPERSKTRENAMFVKPGSAAGARRRGERAVAACFLLRSSENRTTLCAPLGPPSRKRAWRTVRTAHTLLALFARE